MDRLMKHVCAFYCILGLLVSGFHGFAAEESAGSSRLNASWDVVPGILETNDSQRDLLFTFRFPEKSKIRISLAAAGRKREFEYSHAGGQKDTLVYVSKAESSSVLDVSIQAG